MRCWLHRESETNCSVGLDYRHRHSLKVVSRYTNRVSQNHERIERRETIHATGIFSMDDSIKELFRLALVDWKDDIVRQQNHKCKGEIYFVRCVVYY